MLTVFKLSVATTALMLLATFGLFAALPDPKPGAGASSTSYSHALLESDLMMTQRMGTDAQMPMQDAAMLTRSRDPGYLRALEDHSAQVDRMLGRAP